jgi:hypothetical protein
MDPVYRTFFAFDTACIRVCVLSVSVTLQTQQLHSWLSANSRRSILFVLVLVFVLESDRLIPY